MLLTKLEGLLILMMILFLIDPEILEVDLMMITIGVESLKDHQEDLNLKKMNLKKIIWKGDHVGGTFQEPALLLL